MADLFSLSLSEALAILANQREKRAAAARRYRSTDNGREVTKRCSRAFYEKLKTDSQRMATKRECSRLWAAARRRIAKESLECHDQNERMTLLKSGDCVHFDDIMASASSSSHEL